MLRQRKNMVRQRKDTVINERKKKMIEKKEKEKVKQKQNTGDECSSKWQMLPEEIMEKILQFVEFAGQRRLGQVSKSWRSIVLQTLMPGARRQLPWLVPPQSPNCRKNKYLSFLTFPENKLSKGRAVNLKLPKKLQGWWIYGSSKGWLIIVNEKGLNSEMCMLNPISGVLHKLPQLRTVPSFNKFVKTRNWELFGIKEFCLHIKMSSTSDDFSSSSNFVVAAVLHDRKTLCLCRPVDERWSVFSVSGLEHSDLLTDILFSTDTVYLLVWSEQHDGGIAPTRTLDFAYHDAAPLKLKLVFQKQHEANVMVNAYHRDYKIVSNAASVSKLLESTSKEILLVQQMIEFVPSDEENIDGVGGNIDDEVPGGNGDDEVVDNNTRNVRCRTRSFITYKIDPENNNYHMMQSLGDQLLFYGNDDAFSLPLRNIKEVGNNRIYFAMNMFRPNDWEWLPKTYTFDEFGTFDLDGQKIERPFQGMKISVNYRPSWFTPTL